MTTQFSKPTENFAEGMNLDAPINISEIGIQLAIDLYKKMVLIREFEERVNKSFLQGQLPGTLHISFGQEACSVGATAPLQKSDWITITHRGHGQALAKGVSPRSMMAELYAKETGCCHGWGGSLHVGDISVGALPGIAIVGGAVPIAAGLAFASKQKKENKVVVCFLGDGAIAEGDTHEGLNIAALLNLPVVYVCENNQYAISTPFWTVMKIPNIAERVKSYGMQTERVDGNNVVAVYQASQRAIEQSRKGSGPFFIECLTYREGGHKRDDLADYRDPNEVSKWKARSPIKRMKEALEKNNQYDAIKQAQEEAKRAIDDAVAFAESSPVASGELK